MSQCHTLTQHFLKSEKIKNKLLTGIMLEALTHQCLFIFSSRYAVMMCLLPIRQRCKTHPQWPKFKCSSAPPPPPAMVEQGPRRRYG